MAKINISLPDDLLQEAEELARSLRMSRSGFVAEATARYVADVAAELRETERRESIDRATESARELSAHVEPFDGTAAIRRDRERDSRTGGES